MEHVYRNIGSHEQMKHLYENREALENYLARLKELMEPDEESQCGKEKPNSEPRSNGAITTEE